LHILINLTINYRYRKLVLVARRKEKLNEVAEKIKAKVKGTEILVLQADAADIENTPDLIARETVKKFGRKYFNNIETEGRTLKYLFF